MQWVEDDKKSKRPRKKECGKCNWKIKWLKTRKPCMQNKKKNTKQLRKDGRIQMRRCRRGPVVAGEESRKCRETVIDIKGK